MPQPRFPEIRRRCDGSIDISHYEALAVSIRRGQLRAVFDAIVHGGRGRGAAGSAR